jgi:hypothetical protein
VKPHRIVRRRGPTFSLESRVTDGSRFVNLTHRQPFTPQEDSWYSFLLEVESNQGHSAAGRSRSIEIIHLSGTRIRDLPVCNIVPQPTTLPRAPDFTSTFIFTSMWMNCYRILKKYRMNLLRRDFRGKMNYIHLHRVIMKLLVS